MKNRLWIMLAALASGLVAQAAVQPDYWAQYNKDGHQRNASDRTLTGTPYVVWARSFTNFNQQQYPTNAFSGQRANNLCIRNGRVLMLYADKDSRFTDTAQEQYAVIGQYDLRTGDKLRETLAIHRGGGMVSWNVGLATYISDGDTSFGEVNLCWNSNDVVYTAYGSDRARSFGFDASTGTLPADQPFVDMAVPANASGYFSMSDKNPLIFARGGNGGHDSFVGTSKAAGLMGQGQTGGSTAPWMKHYGSFLVDGSNVYAFTVTHEDVPAVGDGTYYSYGLGTKITKYTFGANPYSRVINWTYFNITNSFTAFGQHHGRGAPRAFCLGEDNRIYYYGFRNNITNIPADAPTSGDFYSMWLYAVNATDGSYAFGICATNVRPGSENFPYIPSWSQHQMQMPQIASRTNYVVVFHPQVNNVETANWDGSIIYETNIYTRAHLMCFNVASTSLVWSKDFTNNYFKTKIYQADYNNSANGDNTHQAIQMTIAGQYAFIVDPYIEGSASNGPLRLAVHQFNLTDGTQYTTNLTPKDASNNEITVNSKWYDGNHRWLRLAVKELAAVDGNLVVLLDADYQQQVLVTLAGTANPVNDYPPRGAITSPWSGVQPHIQIYNDYRLCTSAATNRYPTQHRAGTPPQFKIYDTGETVPFDASGSFDPDGGALTYAWNFGDGQTGFGSNTTHAYSSWAGPAVISNVTVRLTVTDNEGNSNTIARTIMLRNDGASSVATLTASADAYINPANTTKTGASTELTVRQSGGITNWALIKFDLSGVDVNSVTDAVMQFMVYWASSPYCQTVDVFAVSNAWTEADVHGGNAPAFGDRVAEAVVNPEDKYGDIRFFYQVIEVPVTRLVKDTSWGTTRSVAVATRAAAQFRVPPKESVTWSDYAPKLILRTGNVGYAAPAITSAPPATILYSGIATQNLSVAASSALGATNLTYNWIQVSGPAGSLTFSKNHSTDAGSTVLTLAGTGGVSVVRCLVDDGTLTTESAPITLTDDPGVEIVVSTNAVTVPEGLTAQFTVTLSASPTNTVTVSVAHLSGDPDISVQSGSSLVFNSSTWSNAQTVTLAATEDGDWVNDSAVIRCFAIGLASVDVTATETDNDLDPSTLLPFVETLEARTAGAINAQYGWVSGAGSVVQGTTVHGGSQALEIQSDTASHSFNNGTNHVAFSWWMKPVAGIAPTSGLSGASAVIWMGTNGAVMVYSGATVVATSQKVDSNVWNKFEVDVSYVSNVWKLSINGTNAADNLALYSARSVFSEISLTGPAFFDDINISNVVAAAQSSALDDWLILHYGNTNVNMSATASNGVNTIEECYIAGLNPTNPASVLLVSDLRPLTSGNTLQWQGVSGRVYSVYWTSNLLSGFQTLESNVPWTGSIFTDAVHGAAGQGFYKIDVRLLP